MLFPCLLVLSVLAAALYIALAAAPGVWGAVGVFLLCYLALNLLLLLVFAVNSLFLPRLAPDEGIKKQNRFCRLLTTLVAQLICGWAGARPCFSGLEKLPEGPFLFVCNHRSMFDPLIVIGYLSKYNISFVSKPSNLRIPAVGVTVRQLGYLPINRENNREALKTILLAADYLKRGLCSIGIYPEGTRSKTGELLPFHAGSFKIAQRAGVPVVVACVRGSEKVKKHAFFWPARVRLDVLAVLDADAVKAAGTAELAGQARELIRTHLEETEGKA